MRREASGAWPPPEEEELGTASISVLTSSMGGARASSSDRGTNSGWAMKLWMELRDSGFSIPSYRELRNAFTTLIWRRGKERVSTQTQEAAVSTWECDEEEEAGSGVWGGNSVRGTKGDQWFHVEK